MTEIKLSTIKEINSLHSELEALLRAGVDKAIRIGELLAECKSKLQHGEFSGWVSQNCSFTMRTAQRYMRVHENRDQLSASNSLSEAYKLLQEKGKATNVSFLDVMKTHLQATVDEDLPALRKFNIREVADKLPDPESMGIESLTAYVRELEEAHSIATECLLKSRRKLDELMNDAELGDEDRQRLQWLHELRKIHPEIRLYERGMHIPEGVTYEQWQDIYRLLKNLEGSFAEVAK